MDEKDPVRTYRTVRWRDVRGCECRLEVADDLSEGWLEVEDWGTHEIPGEAVVALREWFVAGL
jgi:hypothetical protein